MTEPTWTDAEMAAETAARLENLEAPDPDELVGVRTLVASDVSAALARNADIYSRVYKLAEELGALIEYEDGWRGRSASYTLSKIVVPQMMIVHHTAGNFTPTSYIKNGDPGRGLAGPLALGHVVRDGVARILGVGYSNHAGNNDKACADKIIAGKAPMDRDLIPGPDGTWSANRYALSFEVNGDGGPDDWTPAQLTTVVAIGAALHIVMSWPTDTLSPRGGAHKELTRRKPGDPAINMGKLRTLIAAKVAEYWARAAQPPSPQPTGVSMRVASLNLAQRTDWATRKPLVVDAMKRTLKASVYLLQETDYNMAAELAVAMGWGSIDQPCWRTDENRNTVIWDPRKRRDIETDQDSLSAKPGDLADRHYRSASWVLLEDITTGLRVWFGAAHLSNGADAGADRASQARVLVGGMPPAPRVLGIDRNSLGTSEPARILAGAGLVDLTVGADKRRSYPSGDARTDGLQIDAIHGTGVSLTSVALVDVDKATDHRAWVGTLTVPLTSTL